MMKLFLNRFLDRLYRPVCTWGGHTWSVFRLWGYVGLLLAAVLTCLLADYRQYAPGVMLTMVMVASLSCLGFVFVKKLLLGSGSLVCYHQLIVALVVSGSVLAIWRQPVWAYLDLIILGLSLFLACGRLGCLMSGCCHGCPHQWGICYPQQPVTPYLSGVRLFPVQLLMSALLWGIVVGGTGIVLQDWQPGEVLVWFVLVYGIGRFILEFWRGDALRPYWGPFSEAQWLSLCLIGLFAVGQAVGWWPMLTGYGWSTALFAVLVLGYLLYKPWHVQMLVWRPHHVREVTFALKRLGFSAHTFAETPTFPPIPDAEAVRVEKTSLGLHLSVGCIEADEQQWQHYSFSHQHLLGIKGLAQGIARLIHCLHFSQYPYELVPGGKSTFHILVEDE